MSEGDGGKIAGDETLLSADADGDVGALNPADAPAKVGERGAAEDLKFAKRE